MIPRFLTARRLWNEFALVVMLSLLAAAYYGRVWQLAAAFIVYSVMYVACEHPKGEG